MKKIKPVSSILEINQIYLQMNELFGEQDHIPGEVLLNVSKKYKSFVQVITNENSCQLGHIVFIPFNKSGYNKMLNPELDESDIKISDLFDSEIHKKMFIFVYSIYARSSFQAKAMVEQTVCEIKSFHHSIDVDSFIFAEVASKEGGLLANRMSLKEYHSYEFRGEKLYLYNTSLSEYVSSI